MTPTPTVTPSQFSQDVLQQEYNISEVFDTLQGEGRWAGTPMRFIRLAGCNVGTHRGASEDMRLRHAGSPLSILGQYQTHTMCHLQDGGVMLCDTDYRAHYKSKVSELLLGLEPGTHICITGGEPFIHNLSPLVLAAQLQHIHVHIETSGTKPFELHPLVKRTQVWVTCSPKKGFKWQGEQLAAIDEIKLLVHPLTYEEDLIDFWQMFQRENTHCYKDTEWYLSPVTAIPDQPAMDGLVRKAIDICRKYPHIFKLSCQLHKYWGLR
jgi:7-carboxy-7-deazaguanine synthase